MEVLFIRHGATAGNLEKRYIGRTDEPLCPEGIAQAEMLRGRFPPPDVLFASPLLRARQTAELLFPGMDYTVIDDLRETAFGVFEGKTAAELADDLEYRDWVASGCTGPIPGGEEIAAFKTRCCEAFSTAIRSVPADRRAAFVIHGGGIMAILEKFARPVQDFYAYHIGNGEAVLCGYSEKILRIKAHPDGGY